MDYSRKNHGISLRQACLLFCIHISVYYYRPKANEDQLIRKQLGMLAELHTRWGFWMMHHRLRSMNYTWNHKRVYRVYTEMGLNLRRKSKKRLAMRVQEPLLQPLQPNLTWSMDFMHDTLANGIKFRSFNVLDDYNREALNITIDTSINSQRVIRELDKLVAWRGKPEKIRVDNGPEFIAHAMKEWSGKLGIELKFIQKGKPYQNGYVERFNKTYREEVLDAFSFGRLKEAEVLSQAWLWIYNNERPHKALGYIPPIPFAQQRLRSYAPSPLLRNTNIKWKSLVLGVPN